VNLNGYKPYAIRIDSKNMHSMNTPIAYHLSWYNIY